MRTHLRFALSGGCALLALLMARPVSAQQALVSSPDTLSQVRAAGDTPLVHWAERVSLLRDRVYVHNRTDHPVELTGYRLYRCVGVLLSSCSVHPESQLVPAHQTVAVLDVRTPQARRGDGRAYDYVIDAAPAGTRQALALTGQVGGP